MEYVKRHGMGGMNMGSSLSMGSMAMASASKSMSMAMSSSTGMDSDMDMDMGHMDSMHMYFTTQYKNYPVLFKELAASNGGQAFGIFVFLFIIAFLVRGIEFAKNYLEQVVWQNPNYIECHPVTSPAVVNMQPQERGNCCSGNKTVSIQNDNSLGKDSSTNSMTGQHDVEIEGNHARSHNSKLPMASSLFRNIIRLALCILPDLFGFALMLAAMSFTLVYFFAVVLGLGIGRFTFERLSDRLRLRPAISGLHC